MSERLYEDIDGNKISLLQMVRKEPEWAVSRITQLEAENTKLKSVVGKPWRDSKRLDKLDRMKPATLGEVLCRLAKPNANVREAIDKLEEQS